MPVKVNTLADLSFYVAERFPKPALIRRSRGGALHDMSTSAFVERVRDLSLGLQDLGLSPTHRVAIVAESRPEWVVTDLAILAAGAVTVPVYPTLSAPQVRYILNDSGASIAIGANAAQMAKIQAVKADLPALAHVLAMEDDAGAAVDTLDQVAARGRQLLARDPSSESRYRARAAAVRPDDLATLIYTSGTTGEPKGVMLTHANLLSNMTATEDVLPMGPDDVAMSFLPLSHVFERMVVYKYLANGVTIGFAESIDTVGRDMPIIRPTVMTGVPRAYEKIHARVIEAGAQGSPLRRRIFRWAMRVALAWARRRLAGRPVSAWLALQRRLADRLVFAKIRARTGGRLRYLISGSAPLAASVGEFFYGIGLPIVEGYGLTETSPVLTVNPPDAIRFGTVGKVVPGVEVTIANDGEILARGPNVMVGYYNKPEATEEALAGGWFHTGDIGEFDADGYLRITDRKKDLIVTSGGKKLAPQPIEQRLKSTPLVTEAVLIAEGRKFPSALIVPNYAALDGELDRLKVPRCGKEELVRRPEVIAFYQQLVDGLTGDLAQFERVKKIALLPREFTVEAGELTPTMKVRRKVIEERWKATIDELYSGA